MDLALIVFIVVMGLVVVTIVKSDPTKEARERCEESQQELLDQMGSLEHTLKQYEEKEREYRGL